MEFSTDIVYEEKINFLAIFSYDVFWTRYS